MMRVLGVGVYNYDVLAEVMIKAVGRSQNLFGKLVYVLPPEIAESRKKHLRSADFEIVPRLSDGSDDEEIKKRIRELDPAQVSEIVLVSADLLDFQECLAEKIAQGMKVTIVATKEADINGSSMLTLRFDELTQKMGIDFVELAPFKDRLLVKPYIENMVRRERPPVPVRVVELSFIVEENNLAEVMAILTPLSGDCRLLKFTLEVKKG